MQKVREFLKAEAPDEARGRAELLRESGVHTGKDAVRVPADKAKDVSIYQAARAAAAERNLKLAVVDGVIEEYAPVAPSNGASGAGAAERTPNSGGK